MTFLNPRKKRAQTVEPGKTAMLAIRFPAQCTRWEVRNYWFEVSIFFMSTVLIINTFSSFAEWAYVGLLLQPYRMPVCVSICNLRPKKTVYIFTRKLKTENNVHVLSRIEPVTSKPVGRDAIGNLTITRASPESYVHRQALYSFGLCFNECTDLGMHKWNAEDSVS